MNFNNYKDSVIDNFIDDYKQCQTLSRDLTNEEIKDIHERFEEHKECFDNHYKEFCNEDAELFTTCIYGDNISASIECNQCNCVIIDDASIAENDINYK